jgi:Methyltransferase domain
MRGSRASNLAALFDGPQQMTVGERAALEGVLELAKPALAIEIGRAEGGSLRRIAAHSDEVHSLDLVEPPAELEGLDRVVLHTGDSHELLPRLLADLAGQDRNVDFVLVDGDHSAAGVRRDLDDLLASPAIGRTLILIHDTSNEEVRAGLDGVPFDDVAKVAYADLDAVAGRMFKVDSMRNQLWGGLGIVLVDDGRGRTPGEPAGDQRYFDTAALLREARVRRTGLLREAASRLRRRVGAIAGGGRG